VEYTQAEIKAICQTLLERQVINIPYLRCIYPEIAERLAARIAAEKAQGVQYSRS
jgi:hypothetical protein